MKNLLQASKDIKKKLSFDDYRIMPIPADIGSQEVVTGLKEDLKLEDPVNIHEQQTQSCVVTSEDTNFLSNVAMDSAVIIEPTEILLDKSKDDSTRPIAIDAEHSTPKTCCLNSPVSVCIEALAPAQIAVTEKTNHQAGELAKNQTKVKVTHYLTPQDHKALMRIYIKRLQNDIKVDKSALITEALHLLCEKEQV